MHPYEREAVKEQGLTPIGTRWVFTNKGDTVKSTPQKTRFRSVNNYKEFQGIHMQVKSEYVGTLMTTEFMTQSRTTSTTTC